MAADAIRGGGTAVFPTDTVYGLGCNPYDKQAIDMIYEIKSRNRAFPLPVLVPSVAAARKIAVLEGSSAKIAKKFWPGGVTLVLDLIDEDLGRSMGIRSTVAVRIPSCRCSMSLLVKCGPLACTSANKSGSAEPSSIDDVNITGYNIIVDGGQSIGSASTVIDARSNKIKIIREGIISKREIMWIL